MDKWMDLLTYAYISCVHSI